MGALLNKSSANRTAAAPPPPAEDQPKVQTAQTEEVYCLIINHHNPNILL